MPFIGGGGKGDVEKKIECPIQMKPLTQNIRIVRPYFLRFYNKKFDICEIFF